MGSSFATSASARKPDAPSSAPEVDHLTLRRPRLSDLITLEYFETPAGQMPTRIFDQHHVLLNLRSEAQIVENERGGRLRTFEFGPNEVFVTPAGVSSGWRWFGPSKVMVATLDPQPLARFAHVELGVLLTSAQLEDRPHFLDPDLCRAGLILREARERRTIGREIIFESLARIFLVKLVRHYGQTRAGASEDVTAKFSSEQYKSVLDYLEANYGSQITVESLAERVGLTTSRFSALFKEAVGETPIEFLMSYRVERAQEKLENRHIPISEVASSCGFADQVDFSRRFKRQLGHTPSQFRSSL